MDLSIIIVNYNTCELLKQTVQSVIDTAIDFTYEIIIVDNFSSDGSVSIIKKEFRDVVLIENNSNLGYAKANNIGILKSRGKVILLLNSDTIILKDCLKKSLDYIENNKEIGALGCRVVLRDGKLDHACKRGFPTPKASLYYFLKLYKLCPNSKKFGQYDLNYLLEDKINEVDSVMGAFMMVRRDVTKVVGLLDEEFFMYGEDIDWCFRIKYAGWKVIYFPESEIIHYKGASSRKKPFMTLYEFHRAMYLFYKKHYFNTYSKSVSFLVYFGIGIRLIYSILINIFRRRL